MIISKVFPLLIRIPRRIDLIKSPKFSTCSRDAPKTLFFGISSTNNARRMSSNIDSDLNDPKRHFDYGQLVKKIENKNAVVIDVREHSEIQETGLIPGSVHIPLGELAKALGEMSADEFKKRYNADQPQKDSEVIFSCRSGVRSLKALKTGLELGYSKAGNYKGGWLDWSEKQGK